MTTGVSLSAARRVSSRRKGRTVRGVHSALGRGTAGRGLFSSTYHSAKTNERAVRRYDDDKWIDASYRWPFWLHDAPPNGYTWWRIFRVNDTDSNDYRCRNDGYRWGTFWIYTPTSDSAGGGLLRSTTAQPAMATTEVFSASGGPFGSTTQPAVTPGGYLFDSTTQPSAMTGNGPSDPQATAGSLLVLPLSDKRSLL